ncbi:hypothetical protein AUG19_02305 [archaeon 13_1_20CM_2_54_9]|nr:MAG: hypothetical protein AUJ07_03885 [Crenarchaeota archaeon 13_1_40CM_3_53_5]OLE76679.1 MAG: hypothetical protein AUG19_02305 [archaeon 13_1_20CM_2_54_9]
MSQQEGPRNYYAIRMQMVYVRRGKLRYNEKVRANLSYLNTEISVRLLWDRIQKLIDEQGNMTGFRK